MTFALFGISNDGLNLAVNLLVFFLVVIWVALVYWTYSDATRRLLDPRWRVCPYCEAEVAASMRDERGERRRRSRRDGDRQPRVARTVDRGSSTPARGEDAIVEPTASLSGERRASQAPPDG